MCGGGGGAGRTNLQAERRHSQYEKHNAAGMTEGGDDDVKRARARVCVKEQNKDLSVWVCGITLAAPSATSFPGTICFFIRKGLCNTTHNITIIMITIVIVITITTITIVNNNVEINLFSFSLVSKLRPLVVVDSRTC